MNHLPLPVPLHKGIEGFQRTPIQKLEGFLLQQTPKRIEQQSKNLTLRLFHAMAKRVPAYKDFLTKHSIVTKNIQTYEDLQQIPWIDKQNYLKQYPLDQLCWDGQLTPPIISSSSGSSGKPTFWPRSEEIEAETSYIFENFFKNIFEIDKYRTLYISAFAMGIYVGGSFTLNCSMRISQKGYPLTIVTPGINKKEFLESFESLARYYDQIILGGYPPLVKDILDEMEAAEIDIKKHKIRFHFAAEAISEDFRTYMYERAGINREKDYFHSSMNLYGTADAAVAGHETPLAILLRKVLHEKPELCQSIFGATTIPSINAYYPFFKHFERFEGELLFSSAANAVPLCRYNIHDRGDILTQDDVIELIQKHGTKTDLERAQNYGREWNLPYVYLHGKTDNSVKLSGAIIYAESVKKAIEQSKLFDLLTGKFQLRTEHDEKIDQRLTIYVEMKQSQPLLNKEQKQQLSKDVRAMLFEENAEYRAICSDKENGFIPHIIPKSYQDEEFFAPGIKQRWAQQS